MPARLRALFKYAPDMDAFLLDEPLDLGKWRVESFARNEAVAADPESTDEERMAACELEEQAGQDIAAYQMSFFVGDVLVAWLLLSPVDEQEERRAERAMARLVEYACSPPYRKGQALGDALTDAMRPVYTTRSVLLRFAQAGGLPALFDDWVRWRSLKYYTYPDHRFRHQRLRRTGTAKQLLNPYQIMLGRSRPPNLFWVSCKELSTNSVWTAMLWS